MKLFDKLFGPRYTTPEDELYKAQVQLELTRMQSRLYGLEARLNKSISRSYKIQAKLTERRIANLKREINNGTNLNDVRAGDAYPHNAVQQGR